MCLTMVRSWGARGSSDNVYHIIWSCRQNWENFERSGRYNIAEKRTVWRLWILAPGANLKDLMEYINVTNMTNTFRNKSAAPTSSGIWNSGKEKKEKLICKAHPTWVISCPVQRKERKTNLQSSSYVSDQLSSAHTAKRRYCCRRTLCIAFNLTLPSLFVKQKMKGLWPWSCASSLEPIL